VTATGELWLWGRVGGATYSSPVRVLGEQLGAARFSLAVASEWLTVACASADD
jgi:hypothetical protein